MYCDWIWLVCSRQAYRNRSQTEGHCSVAHSGLSCSQAAMSVQAALYQENELDIGLVSTEGLDREGIQVTGGRSRTLFDKLIYVLQKDDMSHTVLITGDMKTNNSLSPPESGDKGG